MAEAVGELILSAAAIENVALVGNITLANVVGTVPVTPGIGVAALRRRRACQR